MRIFKDNEEIESAYQNGELIYSVLEHPQIKYTIAVTNDENGSVSSSASTSNN